MDTLIQFFLHLDTSLASVIQAYGLWTYMLVFIVIFCETGLVIMPLLPGDTLLFIMGAFSATGLLSLPLSFAVIFVAGVLGDTVNYHIGKIIGPKIFKSETSKFLNKKYITQTQKFYEKYGPKTIVIARFMPIIRTFAPFVAGMGSMRYATFFFWNVAGALLWAGSLTLAGYFFGNLPIIRDHLTLMLLAIIALSLTPALFEYLRTRSHKR